MQRRGKGLTFEVEEIEELADMKYSDRRLFSLMALLFPSMDLRNHFHIDHVFPARDFSPSRLREAGVNDEKIEEFRDHANRLGNLQLLDGNENNEKRAKLPADWLTERFPTDEKRQHYCDKHDLGDVPEKISGFEEFYQSRRERLRKRIEKLINVV